MTDTTTCEFCNNTVYLFEGKLGIYYCNTDSNRDFHANTCPKYKTVLFPSKSNNTTGVNNTTGSTETCDFCGQQIKFGDNKRRLNQDGTPHVKKEIKDGKDTYSCIDSAGKEIPRKPQSGKGKGVWKKDPVKAMDESLKVWDMLRLNAIIKARKNHIIMKDYKDGDPLTAAQEAVIKDVYEQLERLMNSRLT